MRTWERGSGETLACGTGACAVCVAGVLSGRTEPEDPRPSARRRPGTAMGRRRARLHDRPGGGSVSGRVERRHETRTPLLEQARRPAGLDGRPQWMDTLDYRVAFYDRASTRLPRVPRAEDLRLLARIHPLPAGVRGHCNLAMLLEPAPRRRGPLVRGRATWDSSSCAARRTAAAWRRLRQLLGRSRQMHLAITPDGPRGPRRRLAPGASTWPRSWACRWWRWATATTGRGGPSSWDRFAIPRPHCRARCIPRGEIFVPPDLDRDGLEHFRLQDRALLNRLTAEAEAWAASGRHLAGEMPSASQRPARCLPRLARP